MIEIEANINIVGFMRPQFSRHKVVFNPEKYSNFKKALGLIAKAEMQGRNPIEGAFKISVDFYKESRYKRTTRQFGDLDNFLKSVLDALNGICYVDDAQCVEIGQCRKFKGKEPKIIIRIEEV